MAADWKRTRGQESKERQDLEQGELILSGRRTREEKQIDVGLVISCDG